MADVPLAKSPVPVADIDATGTADATTYLRGDGSWSTPSGGGGGSTSELLHVQDQQASGTQGGSSSAGWQTRTLNTALTNEITGASLASNQITLPAGTYEVTGSAPSSNANAHQVRFRNVTDGTTALVGTSEFTDGGDNTGVRSLISGKFTLAASKTLEFQHYTQSTTATVGLGISAGSGELEVFADLQIRKVA